MRLPLLPLMLLAVPALGQDAATIKDSTGQELRLVHSGRYFRGMNGGENHIEQSFERMATGQYFGSLEGPAHPCWITKSFYLGTHEITVGQFKSFVAETKYVTTAEKNGMGAVGWSPSDAKLPLYQSYDFQTKPEFTWKNPGFPQQDNHPVVGVSWQDAQAFCQWISMKEGVTYRLPTEAEWEMACHAGTTTWFFWGDEARGQIHRFANIANVELEKERKHATMRHWLVDLEKDAADGHVFTAPVGSFSPNPWGFRDMSGNVWEWCQDYFLDTWYNQYRRPDRNFPDKTAVDPVNLSDPQAKSNSFRVMRGGSWYNGPLQTRPTMRGFFDETDAACYIGFRVVREIPNAPSDPAYEAELAVWKAIEANGGKVYERNQEQNYEVIFGDKAKFNAAILDQIARLGLITGLRLDNEVPLGPNGLAAIGKIGSLERLEIFTSGDRPPGDFAALTGLKKLKALFISRNVAVNDLHLAALEGLTTLEEFTAFGTNGGLTDEGVRKLAGNQGMKSLTLYECDAEGAFLSAFEGAPLERLSIKTGGRGQSGLKDDYAPLLARFPTLKDVDLQSPFVSGGLTAALAKLPNLEGANLQNCSSITDADGVALGKLTKLRSLNLTGTGAGDLTAAALKPLDGLREFSIGSPALTDAGMESVSRLMALEGLNITSRATAVTDKGLAELGRLRRVSRCTILAPNIRGEGLSGFPNIPTLRELTVASPALTDAAFDYLAGCKSLTKLRLLDQNTQPAAALTNEGVFKLQHLSNLLELWVPRGHSGIAEEKMKELDALMPKTSVIVYTVNWRPPAN